MLGRGNLQNRQRRNLALNRRNCVVAKRSGRPLFEDAEEDPAKNEASVPANRNAIGQRQLAGKKADQNCSKGWVPCQTPSQGTPTPNARKAKPRLIQSQTSAFRARATSRTSAGWTTTALTVSTAFTFLADHLTQRLSLHVARMYGPTGPITMKGIIRRKEAPWRRIPRTVSR